MNWDKIKHFTEAELACRCCGQCTMNEQFLIALDMARRDAGLPFHVTSGYRCEKHNMAVGGATNSAHTKGLAVDIACQSSTERMKILKALLRYFDRVGIAKTFIHVDADSTKESGVLWLY